MKFQISRTSYALLSPCEKAFKEKTGGGFAEGGSEDWFLEINSLEELLSLAEDEGDLIIRAAVHWPEIEIYDDYRED